MIQKLHADGNWWKMFGNELQILIHEWANVIDDENSFQTVGANVWAVLKIEIWHD